MIVQRDRLRIELVSSVQAGPATGIGRYARELCEALRRASAISVRLARAISLPWAGRLTSLRHFPVGIEGHEAGSIVHWMQIMGCSLMLWKEVRPAVATVHDLGVLVCDADRALFNRLDRWILNVQLAGLRRMDHYVVRSERTRDGLVSKLGIAGERITVVPSSVDAEHFRPVLNARDGLAQKYGIALDDNALNLIFVGSELPRKNLRTSLEAMHLLKTRGRRVRLLKVGAAGGRRWRDAFLRDIEHLGLRDEVTAVGVVPEEDLPLFYSAADVFVTSTLLEGGFAWCVMEAMACGLPAVATPAALIPESAREAVIVVQSPDAERMADGIESVMDDEAGRRRMGEAGREIIGSFTWEAEVAAVMDVYAQVRQLRCPRTDAT